jgi:hypothetical protein
LNYLSLLGQLDLRTLFSFLYFVLLIFNLDRLFGWLVLLWRVSSRKGLAWLNFCSFWLFVFVFRVFFREVGVMLRWLLILVVLAILGLFFYFLTDGVIVPHLVLY